MISFTKAHACGNDFLIVTEEGAQNRDWADLTRRLCARNTGVGADGIEFFTWTGPKSGRIRLHNADGSVAEISGNGTRCVAAWMAQQLDAKPGDEFEIVTDAGARICRIDEVRGGAGFEVDVTTGMGVPEIEAKVVQLADGMATRGHKVSTGNPHFVIVVLNAEFLVGGKNWQAVGKEICTLSDFPHQTNVEFFRVVSPDKIEIRIWERGVGPTASSGTGTSAAAAAAIARGMANSPLTVVAPGGAQTVRWSGPGTELYLIGPATLIARGEAY